MAADRKRPEDFLEFVERAGLDTVRRLDLHIVPLAAPAPRGQEREST